jgi:hypothetical protein
MKGLHKGGKNFFQWKDLSQAGAREKRLMFVTRALQAANQEYQVGFRDSKFIYFNIGHSVGVEDWCLFLVS